MGSSTQRALSPLAKRGRYVYNEFVPPIDHGMKYIAFALLIFFGIAAVLAYWLSDFMKNDPSNEDDQNPPKWL